MAKRELPSPEVLRQLLRYEPETGKLFWKERDLKFFTGMEREKAASCRRWNLQFSGKEALTASRCGYLSGRILDGAYQAHRVAWAIYYGNWPSTQIDHINGDRKNNKIENLRDVTQQENCRNLGMRSDNSSGHVGVAWFERDQRWRAYITVGGKQVHLGYYVSIGEAVAARLTATTVNGFHANHGRKMLERD